ncbi:MAG: methyltransferase domain-containing protein [Rhodospirillaceae bacterium]|nr:methyltransferase domain-containing protein [Rhodospirillaceae bacterium]
MTSWDPSQYLKFADHRTRPALDLLARIRAEAPGAVVDLGCGAGNVTKLLAERWPKARVTGIDNAMPMLEKARAATPRIAYIHAELDAWQSPAPVDVIYTNAALHWLEGHEALFPGLMRQLAPGGALAVQMPRNHKAPSHTSMVEAAEAGPWKAKLAQVRGIRKVHDPADYYRILAPLASALDIWESEYLQVLAPARPGEHPVVEWTKGTALRPYLDLLDDAGKKGFLGAYTERIAAAYPLEPDGRVLFPFRRIFIVAER